LSKKELDPNITYFLSEELFNGERFTVKGFKIKFSGRPLVTSNEVAFGNNLKYILKRQEVGGRILIYDIKTFMLEGERKVERPSENIGLEVIFTD